MKKPNNYDNTQASGDFTPIELGGHIMVIKEVLETQSRTGKEMLKVSFDFAQDDIQPGYFEKIFKDDIRPDKKWPFAGTAYIMTEDENGNCSRNFKTFTTAVEKSNPGFQIMWGDKFAQCFKNKKVGGVFGIERDYYEGRPIEKRKFRWFRSTDGVKEAEIPKETETNEYKLHNGGTAALPGSDSNGFMNIPDGIDEELPFN